MIKRDKFTISGGHVQLDNPTIQGIRTAVRFFRIMGGVRPSIRIQGTFPVLAVMGATDKGLDLSLKGGGVPFRVMSVGRKWIQVDLESGRVPEWVDVDLGVNVKIFLSVQSGSET